MEVAWCGRENHGMSTSRTPNSPHGGRYGPIVDDVAVRVVDRPAAAPSKLILEIVVDLASSVTSGRARPPSSRPPADERRDAMSMALAVLAGFAVAAGVASLIAIIL
jgi:hypothetical protein